MPKARVSVDFSQGKKFSDFRSDTVTKPCEKMRDAMANAVVGDDIYKDCPTTNALQDQVAQLLGKEAALFTSSGTQANLINMMLLAPNRAQSVIMGDLSHILNYERGGISLVGSIMPRVIPNEADGTLDLTAIQRAIPTFVDPHVSPIAGISLESSQNNCSGRVLRMDYIQKVRKLTKKSKMRMHLDGARSWNASVFLDMEMKEMVKDFDLVSVCLSKGMGCPIGSLVVGSEKDVVEARNLRKIVGGAMRQSGVLAACGIVSLMDWQDKLKVDNENASWVAHEIASVKGILIDPATVETNIIRFKFEPALLKKMKVDYRGFMMKMREEKDILCNAGFNNDYIRLVTHRDVSRKDCEKAVKAIKELTSV